MKKSKKRQAVSSACKYRFLAALVFLLISGNLLLVSTLIPETAEWYSDRIYRPAAAAVSGLTGRVLFSLAEFGLYLLILLLLFSVVYTIRKIIRNGSAGRRLLSWLSGICLAASLLAFFFMLGAGINYHRVSFSEKAGIAAEPCTAEDLSRICSWLTREVNARSTQVTRDENGVMTLTRPEGPDAAAAMENLGTVFPDLSGSYPMPKKVFFSQILSSLDLTGIFSAFTIEANYNGDITPYNIPFTVCHELSHLRGFMQEEEANFIAFLACIQSDQPDFQYSGYLSGWVYCMNALYTADHDTWSTIRSQLSPTAEPDLTANREFWAGYQGILSEVSTQVNDTYLKINGQSDGVLSYDRMVELIAAYFRDNPAVSEGEPQ